MLYYPQLESGAVSQFPVMRNMTMRTVANELPSGFTIRMADAGYQKVQWRLRYASLTDAERTALENLFEASEGQLNTFTLLDPTANLLTWSEDWTQGVWTADPLLEVTGGVADPLGGNGGIQLTNTAQSTRQILQSTNGPSSYQYCFSVYVRSNASTAIALLMSATGQTVVTQVMTMTAWTRVVTSGKLSVQADGIAFGVQLPAGAQVNVFGAQVEAQPQAGVYKKTTDLGGVYANTRFSSDAITFASDAPDQSSGQIELISNLN